VFEICTGSYAYVSIWHIISAAAYLFHLILNRFTQKTGAAKSGADSKKPLKPQKAEAFCLLIHLRKTLLAQLLLLIISTNKQFLARQYFFATKNV
jgi:hypothetical protein